jgi:uncharacterized membrane protein YfcA
MIGPGADVGTGPTGRREAAPGRWRHAFALWLVVVYTVWAGVVVVGGLWPTVRSHWPIAVAMAGGSFVAGSSPVAGGTVGFPVLVYVFDHPARLGRDFSLAIQSVGMVSASLYILTRRRVVEWRLLRFALLGAALAMPAGYFWVAPRVGDATVKVLFSVVYASFGLLHLFRLREIVGNQGPSRTRYAADPTVGLATGVMGGLLASLIGVGADILLYGVLVLLYHADVKVAIPTSVLLMAFTSVVGLLCATLTAGGPAPGRTGLLEVVPYWLAAAPVVAVGGPLGSLVSRRVPRGAILGFVAVLCLAQYAVTCVHERIGGWWLVLSVAAVAALNLTLHALFSRSRERLRLKA